jgi:hypothetical protein
MLLQTDADEHTMYAKISREVFNLKNLGSFAVSFPHEDFPIRKPPES